jgi:hypothetical protein
MLHRCHTHTHIHSTRHVIRQTALHINTFTHTKTQSTSTHTLIHSPRHVVHRTQRAQHAQNADSRYVGDAGEECEVAADDNNEIEDVPVVLYIYIYMCVCVCRMIDMYLCMCVCVRCRMINMCVCRCTAFACTSTPHTRLHTRHISTFIRAR